MKVALFFDGKNFYKAFRRYAPDLEIDYSKLANWLTGQVSGGGDFVGARYYTGFTDPRESGLSAFSAFLNALEMQLGYFVKREPRVRRTAKCNECGFTYTYHTEKRVDTRLVADMIHFAAVNAYDVAVLLSGDQDFAPRRGCGQRLGEAGLSRDLARTRRIQRAPNSLLRSNSSGRGRGRVFDREIERRRHSISGFIKRRPRRKHDCGNSQSVGVSSGVCFSRAFLEQMAASVRHTRDWTRQRSHA